MCVTMGACSKQDLSQNAVSPSATLPVGDGSGTEAVCQGFEKVCPKMNNSSTNHNHACIIHEVIATLHKSIKKLSMNLWLFILVFNKAELNRCLLCTFSSSLSQALKGFSNGSYKINLWHAWHIFNKVST